MIYVAHFLSSRVYWLETANISSTAVIRHRTFRYIQSAIWILIGIYKWSLSNRRRRVRSIRSSHVLTRPLITFFFRQYDTLSFIDCVLSPNPFQMDERHLGTAWKIFKGEVTIDYASGEDKKRNSSISYVAGGRRPAETIDCSCFIIL